MSMNVSDVVWHRLGERDLSRIHVCPVGTPHLLLASAHDRHPGSLADSSGLVRRNLMTQSDRAAWDWIEQGMRSSEALPRW